MIGRYIMWDRLPEDYAEELFGPERARRVFDNRWRYWVEEHAEVD